tara:strand:+ start:547 stop:1698 length:1152 start_codon:yes stop_codon:yes gene_type:complete
MVNSQDVQANGGIWGQMSDATTGLLADLGNIGLDQMAASGNLDNWDGQNPTNLEYPPTMHANPNEGHIVLFKMFHKKNAKFSGTSYSTVNLAETDVDKIGDLNSMACPACHQYAEGQLFMHDYGIHCNEASNETVVEQEQLLNEDTRLGRATEESKDSVALFMPRGLKNTDTIEYSDVDFGLIKGIMEGNLASLIPGMAQKAAGLVDGLAQITNTELNASSAINAITGAVRSTRREQLFEGTLMRTFDFAFNFFPKNSTESLLVKKICDVFRFHAYPEVVAGNAFTRFPSEFEIKFANLTVPTASPWQQIQGLFGIGEDDTEQIQENYWINRIGRSALTSVNVEYFPNDAMSTFRNGAPTAVNLSLTFQEMHKMDRAAIKLGY